MWAEPPPKLNNQLCVQSSSAERLLSDRVNCLKCLPEARETDTLRSLILKRVVEISLLLFAPEVPYLTPFFFSIRSGGGWPEPCANFHQERGGVSSSLCGGRARPLPGATAAPGQHGECSQEGAVPLSSPDYQGKWTKRDWRKHCGNAKMLYSCCASFIVTSSC